MATQSTHQVYIDIAGFVVALTTTDQAIAERIQRRYQAFLSAPTEAQIQVAINLVPGAVYIDPNISRTWVIESSYARGQLSFTSYGEQGTVDLATGRGQLNLNPSASVENFLRVVYAWLCVNNQALLLHSAGVVRSGQGYVFFGPSGAGKTTTSRLAAATADVLSDDLVIIRRRADGYHLYGVPFKGELSDAPRANQTAPLRGIFRLRQDRQHFLAPLNANLATAELIAAAPFVATDKNLSPQLIAVCHNIVREVPVHYLHFRRDPGFWKVIDGYYENVSPTASPNGR